MRREKDRGEERGEKGEGSGEMGEGRRARRENKLREKKVNKE